MHGSKEGLGAADIIHQNRKTQEELDLDFFFCLALKSNSSTILHGGSKNKTELNYRKNPKETSLVLFVQFSVI